MTKLTKPNEISFDSKYFILIYGEPGVGKTTTALSANNSCLIDFEGGMKRVQPQFWIPSLQVKNYNDVIKLLNSDELKPFDTIVIDPLSAVIDSMISYICEKFPKLRNGNSLCQRGWGELKQEFTSFSRILKSKQKNVIFIAHEKREKIDDSFYMTPDLGSGSSGNELIKHIEIIGRMSRLNGKRVMYFDAANSEFYCKNPYNLPNSIIIEDPKANSQNNFISKVIEPAIANHFELMSTLRSDFNKLADSIDIRLAEINNAEACNSFYKEVTQDKDLSIKGYLWRDKLLEKIKELNLSFDSESKEFKPCTTK